MCDRPVIPTRKSNSEPFPPPKSRIPNRKNSGLESPDKRVGSFKNSQKQRGSTYHCTCAKCSNQVSCCCVEDLEVIEEEQEQCEETGTSYKEATDEPVGVTANSKSKTKTENPTVSKSDTSQSAEEDDPCGEFFDVMRSTMESAVKKALETSFQEHLCPLVEKLDALFCQLERSERIISKVYADLNEKISYYGERNAQQFQYLCVRMEHDRLFYQQQQEFFLKAVARCPDLFGCQDQAQANDQDPAAEHRKSTLQKMSARCGADDNHNKGWDCSLGMDNVPPCNPPQPQCEEEDKGSEKSVDVPKNQTRPDVSQRRSESGQKISGKSKKSKN